MFFFFLYFFIFLVYSLAFSFKTFCFCCLHISLIYLFVLLLFLLFYIFFYYWQDLFVSNFSVVASPTQAFLCVFWSIGVCKCDVCLLLIFHALLRWLLSTAGLAHCVNCGFSITPVSAVTSTIHLYIILTSFFAVQLSHISLFFIIFFIFYNLFVV